MRMLLGQPFSSGFAVCAQRIALMPLFVGASRLSSF